MNKTVITTLISAALATLVSRPGLADDLQDKIAHARLAAPTSISADATVMVDGKVVAEGTNGWTCMPDTMPGDGAAMCNDAEWMKLMQAMGSKADFKPTGVGVSYMLLGDIGAGVSNSDPFNPLGKEAPDYVESGPHLMILVPRELLKGFSRDPSTGGPYVMWGDTPYAHIMVPVADK